MSKTKYSVYNTHINFQSFFSGKKCTLYTGKYGILKTACYIWNEEAKRILLIIKLGLDAKSQYVIVNVDDDFSLKPCQVSR